MDTKYSDLTLREFVELPPGDVKDKYTFLARWDKRAEARDVFGVGELRQCSFEQVKDGINDLRKGRRDWYTVLAYIAGLSGKTTQELADNSAFDLIAQYKYIETQLNDISEKESAALAHEPTTNEINAGIEELDKFGVYHQYRALSGGDVTKMDAVGRVKYSICFTELLYQKSISEYRARYTEVQKTQTQTNDE